MMARFERQQAVEPNDNDIDGAHRKNEDSEHDENVFNLKFMEQQYPPPSQRLYLSLWQNDDFFCCCSSSSSSSPSPRQWMNEKKAGDGSSDIAYTD